MAAAPTVADLLNILFETHLRPDGKEYTNTEVARGIAAIAERMRGEAQTLDPSYIGKIRSGAIKNPGRDTLLYLCLFFQVPAAYFFPELNTLPGPTALDADAQIIHLRTLLRQRGLSPEATAHIEGLIQAITRAPGAQTNAQGSGEA